MKLKRRINPEVERKVKDALFVGRLVNESDIDGVPTITEPVYYKDDSNEYIQFHIKCLSAIPEEISSQFYFPNKIFTGSTVSRNNYNKLCDWMEYDRLYHFDREKKVRNYFQDKLIVFTLNIKPEMIYVELLKIENIMPFEKGYLMIPSPQLKLDETQEDFEDKMVGIRKPFTLKHYPHILVYRNSYIIKIRFIRYL